MFILVKNTSPAFLCTERKVHEKDGKYSMNESEIWSKFILPTV